MKAAIDIGSNSIRLALSDGTTMSEITQLAYGIEKTGELSESGVKATVAALKAFKAECLSRGATDIFAFATEAVRRASDGKSFCDTVQTEVGLKVNILSPEKEAELALKGCKKPAGAVTVCDLGGGSLEVISSRDGKSPDYIKSLPLGVVVLKNKFNGDYIKAINSLPAMLEEYGKINNYPVVMCGGSACNIAAAILNLNVYDKNAVSTKFTAKQLDDIMPVLLSEKLPVLRPICTKRADTVPYGAIAIQALINYIGATEFYVSDASNLEAILN